MFAGSCASDSLDTRTFVVVGEGLAAGVGHFGLSDVTQKWSFPAQMARQFGSDFEQPLLEPPGVANVIGLREIPVIVPDLLQTTVLRDFPPARASLSNLSVPGFTVADALATRPAAPIVARDDSKQTLANLILGMPGLLEPDGELPTQIEYASGRRPSLVLLELGYHEALDAMMQQDPDRLPDSADYERLLDALGGSGARLLVTTIPDPLDTAYFPTLDTAAAILRTEASFLQAQYGFADDDRITLPGLLAIGYEFTARQISGEPPAGSVLPAAVASRISNDVAALNEEITSLAEARGAAVYDLHGFFHRVAEQGVEVGDRTLTSRLLDGFYLLNGVYPGPTGHALIANDLLAWLNETSGTSFAPVDLQAVAAEDGNLLSRLAPGPTFTEEYLKPRTPAELPPPPQMEFHEVPIQTVYPQLQYGKEQCEPLVGVPACGYSNPEFHKPLTLPKGLEQTLPINRAGSYFGDALRAVDCPDDQPFTGMKQPLPAFGSCGDTRFGGLAITDSPLNGAVHVKFSEPNSDNVTRFEFSHPGGGLMGENGVLTAPQFFKLPAQLNMVFGVPGLVSWGELDLDTGAVNNLHYNVGFINTAILSLFGVNPKLPVVAMLFPGPPNGGSSWARFDQRPDGKLDFTLAGNLFLPLGTSLGEDPVRFPLQFCNPMLQCASIVTRGLTLHPHIHFTTKESLGKSCGDNCPEFAENTVQEFTPYLHNTSFGDVFGLEMAEFGGSGTGRSHLMGRLRVQFGSRFGDSIPMAVSVLPPGGLLSQDPAPLSFLPPGTSRGVIGFNELLEFPKVTYQQRGLAYADDPLNLSVGAVNLRTGRVLDELLHRGYVQQALFEALIGVEPCTPNDSFCYQGEASFERGVADSTVLRFDGGVYLPYPEGFKFPSPDGKIGYEAQAGSRLDPFLRFQAMHGDAASGASVVGGAERVTSSIGQEFSYSYAMRCDGEGDASFEYTNHTEDAVFTLTRVSWVSCTNSRGSASEPGQADTVTFSGFGGWSKDDALHQVSVQIAASATEPYVGIQVDGSRTSNVNTKPVKIEDSYP